MDENWMIDDEYPCDPPVRICEIVEEKPDLANEKCSQWSTINDCIISVNDTFKTLESGYYSISQSQSLGLYFKKEKIELNKLYRLPNEATNIIMDDIGKFWTLEETYKKYERVFKRNYLIYSEPGTGKTSLINIMCQDLIEKYNGIVFSLSNMNDLELFPDAMKRLRGIEPDRRVIAIIEDIDNFCDYRHGSLNTLLLNILDGNLKTSNLVIIATTNYIDKLEARYTNRPSRFDRVIEFPLPNDDSRRMFIEKTVKPEDITKIDINKWVERTKNFTIDHINELILLYFVFGYDEEEAFSSITKMVKNNNNLRNTSTIDSKKVGFN
jgi:hypothetical protein